MTISERYLTFTPKLPKTMQRVILYLAENGPASGYVLKTKGRVHPQAWQGWAKDELEVMNFIYILERKDVPGRRRRDLYWLGLDGVLTALRLGADPGRLFGYVQEYDSDLRELADLVASVSLHEDFIRELEKKGVGQVKVIYDFIGSAEPLYRNLKTIMEVARSKHPELYAQLRNTIQSLANKIR
jgi:hypothetical protein